MRRAHTPCGQLKRDTRRWDLPIPKNGIVRWGGAGWVARSAVWPWHPGNLARWPWGDPECFVRSILAKLLDMPGLAVPMRFASMLCDVMRFQVSTRDGMALAGALCG